MTNQIHPYEPLTSQSAALAPYAIPAGERAIETLAI